jgi:hypothetical protein
MKNRTSNSAHYTRICKYGLSVMLATLALTSCNKKEVTTTNGTSLTVPKSTARLITGQEASGLITEVNNFLPYAQAVSTNPTAPIPTGVPTELADADVKRYLENTFNFVYIQQEDFLAKTTTDQYTLSIAKNNNGNTNIVAVAQAFGTAYNHTLTAYNALACPANEKILRATGIDITSSTATTLTLTIRNVFNWHYVPTLPAPPAGGATAFTFPSGWR